MQVWLRMKALLLGCASVIWVLFELSTGCVSRQTGQTYSSSCLSDYSAVVVWGKKLLLMMQTLWAGFPPRITVGKANAGSYYIWLFSKRLIYGHFHWTCKALMCKLNLWGFISFLFLLRVACGKQEALHIMEVCCILRQHMDGNA